MPVEVDIESLIVPGHLCSEIIGTNGENLRIHKDPFGRVRLKWEIAFSIGSQQAAAWFVKVAVPNLLVDEQLWRTYCQAAGLVSHLPAPSPIIATSYIQAYLFSS